MKAFVLFLILAFAFSLPARADFTIIQKVEGQGTSNEIIIKLKDNRVRMETTPQMTMIVDGKTGDTITLINTRKKFLRIPGDKAQAIAEMAAKYGATTVEKPKVAATGRKKTINGYETEEYVAETSTFKASYWIAPKFPDSVAIVKQLQSVIPAAWNDMARGTLDYRDLPGFPLKIEVKSGEQEMTCTLVAVKVDPLSDAEFSVPPDFQEMKAPNVKEISGDQAATPSPPRP